MDAHTVLFVDQDTEIRADANLYALKLGEPGQCAIFFAAGEREGREQAVAALHGVTQLIAAATLLREAALRVIEPDSTGGFDGSAYIDKPEPDGETPADPDELLREFGRPPRDTVYDSELRAETEADLPLMADEFHGRDLDGRIR